MIIANKIPYEVYCQIRAAAYGEGYSAYQCEFISRVQDSSTEYNVRIRPRYGQHDIYAQINYAYTPFWGDEFIGTFFRSRDLDEEFLERYMNFNIEILNQTYPRLLTVCPVKGMCVVDPLGAAAYASEYDMWNTRPFNHLAQFERLSYPVPFCYTVVEVQEWGITVEVEKVELPIERAKELLSQLHNIYAEVINGVMGIPVDVNKINQTIKELQEL